MVTVCGWRGGISDKHGKFKDLSCLFMIQFVASFFFCGFSYFDAALQQRHFISCNTAAVELFSGFSGAAGPRLFTIHQIDASTNNLPKAHTW